MYPLPNALLTFCPICFISLSIYIEMNFFPFESFESKSEGLPGGSDGK